MDFTSFINSVKTADRDLRPYQLENKIKIYKSWCNSQSVMLQMPTGTGKTRLFVSILRDFHNYARDTKKPIRVLILVHRIELIDQISDELGVRYGLAHGFIHTQDRERRKFPFQIASVQTLNRRLDSWSDYSFDFIIVDEAHHILAESYKKIITTFPNAKILGVTATPYRLSGAGFRQEFNELIESSPISKFIEDGYLSKFEYYSIAPEGYLQHQINEIKGKDVSGDYATAEMMEVCDRDSIRAEVVKTYLDFANGKKGIVYTINKLHNKHICEAFCAQGINAVAIDSDTDKDKREKLIEDFRRGRITILCNVDIFSEGFDCPDIEFVQLARPTKSLALYMQQVGRGLRIVEGKEKTIFLDNVGVYNRFGLPDANRLWNDYFNGVEGVVEHKREVKHINNKTSKQILRDQDFSEGNEKVHLIHSSMDCDYLFERAKLIYECDSAVRNLYVDFIIGRKYDYADYISKQKDKGLKFSLKETDFFRSLRVGFFNPSDIEHWILAEWENRSRDKQELVNDLDVEVIDESYFRQRIQNETISNIEQYVRVIKEEFDQFIIRRIKTECKEDYLRSKSLMAAIKKQRIGENERKKLDTAYSITNFLWGSSDDKKTNFPIVLKLLNNGKSALTEQEIKMINDAVNALKSDSYA